MIYRMPVYMYVLSALSSLISGEMREGTRLHIRLATTVGTYATKPGTPVRAFLIAPVTLNGATLLPAGSILAGQVKSVQRVGLGFVHESASLNLSFDQLILPDGRELNIATRMIQVDNGRERVSRNGLIRGTRTTGSLSYRACGYIKTALLWQFEGELAFWAIKTLVVQVPEPELYYPAGVEFT